MNFQDIFENITEVSLFFPSTQLSPSSDSLLNKMARTPLCAAGLVCQKNEKSGDFMDNRRKKIITSERNKKAFNKLDDDAYSSL